MILFNILVLPGFSGNHLRKEENHMGYYEQFRGACVTGGDSTCKKPKRDKCEGCVCEFFHELNDTTTFCNTNGLSQFAIVLKGNGPLALGGDTNPTLFRFVNFKPKSCCVVLSYEVTPATGGTATRNLIIDCNDISGITCVNDGDLGTGNAI